MGVKGIDTSCMVFLYGTLSIKTCLNTLRKTGKKIRMERQTTQDKIKLESLSSL